MSDPTFFNVSIAAWTALATFVMALAAIASAWVGYRLMRSQDRVIEIQADLTELQRRANWLNGALESHSAAMLRMRAGELGKQVIWWDPTHDGPKKQRPPGNRVHGEAAAPDDPVYLYVPLEERRYPDIT